MIEWIKDALGINQYVVAWRFKRTSGRYYESRDSRTVTRKAASHVARSMNRDYGAGTHWIERA